MDETDSRVALSRRCGLALFAAAVAIRAVKHVPKGRRTVVLCPESQAIIRRLIDQGKHETPEEVVAAALDAMRARDRTRLQ